MKPYIMGDMDAEIKELKNQLNNVEKTVTEQSRNTEIE